MPAQSRSRIAIAFTPVKGDRPESTVAHLTELGADEIVILPTDRSVVRFDAARAERQLTKWTTIVRQSAAQSRRLRIPESWACCPLSSAWPSTPKWHWRSPVGSNRRDHFEQWRSDLKGAGQMPN